MRIEARVITKDVLSALTSYERSIDMSCKDSKCAIAYLQDIDIVLPSEPRVKDGILSITPYEITQSIEYNNVPPSFTELFPEGLASQAVNVPDFESSEQFYKKISHKNSPLKIISDQFSIRRGEELFKIISNDELHLRRLVKKYSQNSTTSDQAPSNPRKDSADDIVAQYGLFELLEKHLLRQSSSAFYLDRLNIAETDKDRLLARESTVVDELGMSVSKDDFNRYTRVRNAVMHFKVITHQDAVFMVGVHEKLIHYNFERVTREMYFDSIVNEAD